MEIYFIKLIENILYCNRHDFKMLIYDESNLSQTGWSTRNKYDICEIILNKAILRLIIDIDICKIFGKEINEKNL